MTTPPVEARSTPRLTTTRCVLRPAERADFASLDAAVRSPGFPPQLPLARLAASGELTGWLDGMCGRMTQGRAHLWSIDLADGTRCIGQVSLVPRHGAPAWALAFWLHPAHWRSGLAHEAAQAAVDAAFATLGIDSIWAGVAAWNARSAALLRRLGFRVQPGNDADRNVVDPTLEFILERS